MSEFKTFEENLIGSVQAMDGFALDRAYCPGQSAVARKIGPREISLVFYPNP